MEIHPSNSNFLIDNFYFDELEKEKGAAWLIEKIFNSGTVEDIRAVRKYYGDERIKKEAVKIHWLSKETLSLFSSLYDIPKEDFITWQLLFNSNKFANK